MLKKRYEKKHSCNKWDNVLIFDCNKREKKRQIKHPLSKVSFVKVFSYLFFRQNVKLFLMRALDDFFMLGTKMIHLTFFPRLASKFLLLLIPFRNSFLSQEFMKLWNNLHCARDPAIIVISRLFLFPFHFCSKGSFPPRTYIRGHIAMKTAPLSFIFDGAALLIAGLSLSLNAHTHTLSLF